MSKQPVVVIGLGPAGIVAARVLGDAGIPVVAFQAPSDHHGRARLIAAPPTVRRNERDEARLASSPPAGADRIGGSKHLAAPQSLRFSTATFRMASTLRARYGNAVFPADAEPANWPVDGDDLLEYYERVEHLMGVGVRPARPWTERMAAAARRLGHHPFPSPAAASTDASPLLPSSSVMIVEASVLAITLDSAGEADGVEYLTADGDRAVTRARAVIVAASVLPTIRLLLLSGVDGGGQVGRHFLSHNTFVVSGWFPGAQLERDSAGPATAVAISEYEDDNFDHTGRGFVGGSLLQAAMTGPRSAARSRALAASLPEDFGDAVARRVWVARNEGAVGAVWAQPDQVPRVGNRVDLDPAHGDALGRPVARITFDLGVDDHARAEFLAERMSDWLRAAGAERTWSAPLEPQPLGTHLYGGARMGADPASSVVDGWGRVHRTPGLIVVGSATFPATSGRGPVQTIEALAWRTADRLAADLR